MKKTFLFAGLIMISLSLNSQQTSWKIKINGKTLLTASIESPETNTRKVKQAEWKKNGSLEIQYTEEEPGVWWRSFLFYDTEDNELMRTDSSDKIKVQLSKLRNLFKGKKEIIIYTTVAPRDPNLAVRIRRVHLCTLKLP